MGWDKGSVKRISSSEKYKHVHFVFHKGEYKWLAQYSLKKDGCTWHCFHDTEREAALAVDKYLISLEMEPVNILKRVCD